jgi:hemolysin activation/secretion protein
MKRTSAPDSARTPLTWPACSWSRRRSLTLLTLWMASGILSAQVLPPPPTARTQAPRLSDAARIHVQAFRFEGNRAFSTHELEAVTAPFTQRELTSEDLEEVRRAVTLQYIQNGYVNSGAVIPDQDPLDGVILIRVVEGELTDLQLHGNR